MAPDARQMDSWSMSDTHQGGALPSPPPPGRALEKLVATIERVLTAKSGAVIIEAPKRIPDKVTGQPREHDIILTLREGHHWCQ